MAGSSLHQDAYQGIVADVLGGKLPPETAAHGALLLAYCPNRDEPRVFGAMEELLGQALENLRDPVVRFGGLHAPNFDAWVFAHVGDDDVVGNLDCYDERLLALLQDRSLAADHGLRRGLAGSSLYALERWRRGDHALAKALLTPIVGRLRDLARHDADGLYWTTGFDYATDTLDPALPYGYQNLGVLHGIPGVLACLGAIHETGEVACADMVQDGTRWVLAQFADDDAHPSRLADVAGLPQLAKRHMAAWCLGDLGALAAMWNALRRAKLSEAPIMPHIEYALRREQRAAVAADAALCHGAAGIAHIWHRMHLATGRADFLAAAQARLVQAMTLRQAGLGFGGFGAFATTGNATARSWVTKPHFLEGAIGVALAMQASWLEEEPAWDRLLAIDIPPATGRP